MTGQALKELLDVLPADVLALEVTLEMGKGMWPARMVLIDPPGNFQGLPPKLVISGSHQGDPDRNIICLVSPRV